MEQLSALDAACLKLESPHNLMHIGGLYRFSTSAAHAKVTFKDFKAHLAARIQAHPRLTQRLLGVPLNLDAPYWIQDTNFNLDLHLYHIGLPAPHNEKSLWTLANQLYQKPLDRTRALWEIYYVDGCEQISDASKGAFALIIKTHQALTQQYQGACLFSSLIDFSYKTRAVEPKDTLTTDPAPSPLSLVTKSLKRVKSPIKLMLNALPTTAQALAIRTLGHLPIQPNVDNLTASLFDCPLGTQTNRRGQRFSMPNPEKFQAQFPETECTEQLLMLCTSGLRGYLSDQDQPLPDTITALVPRATQPSQNQSAQLSTHPEVHENQQYLKGTLVTLAVGDAQPLVRLQKIKASVHASLEQNSAIPLNTLTDQIPTQQMSLATKVYTQWHFSEQHSPYYNLIINLVPGPQAPLYLQGATLHELYALTPMPASTALVINIYRYHTKLCVSTMSCAKRLPHFNRFYYHLEHTLNQINSFSFTQTKSKFARRIKQINTQIATAARR